MTDYISRADAIEAVCKWCEHPYCKSKEECGQWIAMTILPSADDDCSTCKHNDKDWDSVECDSCCGNNNHYESAEADMSEYADRLWKIAYERGKREASAKAKPTVVRCKTMIPYGDFREWAKRIREDNPNVIVIPFDAEVASAEAVQGEWIFNTDENNGKSWNVCSVCGYSIFHTTNFCPNCGARMKGGEK